MKLEFRKATEADLDEIWELYRSLVDLPGCTWNEEYPSREIISGDIGRGDQFCLVAEDGRIAASAAVHPADELEKLFQWNGKLKAPCELSRLGVGLEVQNQGVGKRLLMLLLEEARRRGYDGMQMLVGQENHAALSLYRSLGFAICGETHCYETDWFCLEKEF